MARALLVAVAAALLILPALAGAEPVSIDVDFGGDPRPGAAVPVYITVSAEKRADVIVSVDYYVPGTGWLGWYDLWEGTLYGSRTIVDEVYIPEDAETGNVIVWVAVHYYRDDSYTVIEGETYYVTKTKAAVSATMYSADDEALREEYEELVLEREELEARYEELEAQYESLSYEYEELRRGYSALQDENAMLRETISELREELGAARARAETYMLLSAALAVVASLAVASRVIAARKR